MKRRTRFALAAMADDLMPVELRNVDIASFYPTERYIQKLVLGIEPVQDLHGYDNPWPAGGGKNKIDGQDITIIASTDNQYAVTDSTVTFAAGTYTLSFTVGANVTATRNRPMYLVESTPTYAETDYRTQGRQSWTFTLSEETTLQFKWWGHTLSANCTISDFMLETGSSASSFAPYSNICPISGWTGTNIYVSPTLDVQDATVYPISWHNEAGTVYGGTLDVLTGVLTVTWKSADMGDFPWVLRNNNQHRQAWKTDVSDMKFVPNDYPNPPPLLCEILKTIVPNTSWRSYEITYYDGQLNAMVATNEYADAEAFTTAMSGVQLVYEIATPLTYQLTPQQIATLHPGINNVWCDTGPVIELIS